MSALRFCKEAMGIKGLNTFLNTNCVGDGKGIDEVHLSAFTDKTVVFDFTNQLYRFLYRDATEKSYLLEFINLIHKFQRYGIKVVFVLDGKPIVEKQYVIDHRKAYREKIIKKIDEISESSDNSDDQINSIKHLSKKTTTVKASYIVECKKLFDNLGIPYIHIDNMEADAIFKYLLDNNMADACFSADTDVIAYGCHTILKELDYINDTVQCINYPQLLNTLGISHEKLLYTCILSGTDYNNSLKRSKFEINLQLIKKYNTISNVIDNLDEINNAQPDEYKKDVPVRFDWQNALSVFTESIPCDVQKQIHNYLTFTKTAQCVNNKSHTMQLQKYLETVIGMLDRTQKYSRKLIEIVQLKFNIQLKCPSFRGYN